jgi:predicted NAD/FAD-binding protein
MKLAPTVKPVCTPFEVQVQLGEHTMQGASISKFNRTTEGSRKGRGLHREGFKTGLDLHGKHKLSATRTLLLHCAHCAYSAEYAHSKDDSG